MTNDKRYELLCAMLRDYDLHTGNRGAEGVIANPEKWTDAVAFPIYASAAELLLEARRGMDAKTTPRTVQTAVNRILKNAMRDEFKGLFLHDEKFVACDGYRLVRLNSDISSLPHTETAFDVRAAIGDLSRFSIEFQLPSESEVRAFIAARKEKFGKYAKNHAYRPCADRLWYSMSLR